MRYGTWTTFAVMIGLVSGCVNPYPLPLKEPTEQDSVLQPHDAIKHHNGTSTPRSTQREANPNRPGALVSALSKPASMHDLKVNLLIYRDHYLMAQNELIKAKTATTDITLAGGIIAVIGGLVESTSTVYTGGAIAAGSSIYDQRYNFEIQAVNYRKASETMDCMLSVVSPISDIKGLSSPGITTAAQQIEEVRRKLYKAQSAVVLVDPDLSQLKNALAKSQSAEVAFIDLTKRNLAPGATLNSISTLEEALALARLDECVKSF
jgi:hypothetical protein